MSEPQAVAIPLIPEPMKLYEHFRREALTLAPLVVQDARTLEDADSAYTVVHRLTMMVYLLSGEHLDAEGVVALIRKLQEDVAGVQGAMFAALTRRQAQEEG